MTQTLIQTPGPLLAPDGHLNAVGWSPHPRLDCNDAVSENYLILEGRVHKLGTVRARW